MTGGAPAVWTPLELVKRSAEYLAGKGVASARLDAELLLGHVLDTDRMGLYIGFERPLTTAEVDRYRELIRRRGTRVPLQRLTGEGHLLDLTLQMADDVFIPRPETESLVELCDALPHGEGRPVDLVEVGPGSGAIGVALLTRWPQARLVAFERSPAAVDLTRRNAEALGVGDRLEVRAGDVFEAECPPCDLLVSNPPYIPTADIDGLDPEVRDHDPHLALDGGPDGLAFVRRLVRWAVTGLRPGGWLVLEHGDGQDRAVAELLDAHGLTGLESQPDLSGRPRVVAGRAASG